MQFLKFLQQDPNYEANQSEVVVAVNQIVKIEPRWYEETTDGRKYLAHVDVPGPETIERGLQKEFVVFDSLGNAYESLNASQACRKLIEQIWLNAL